MFRRGRSLYKSYLFFCFRKRRKMNMEIEIAYIIAGTMIFVGFIVGAGIIYSGLEKIANAINKQK